MTMVEGRWSFIRGNAKTDAAFQRRGIPIPVVVKKSSRLRGKGFEQFKGGSGSEGYLVHRSIRSVTLENVCRWQMHSRST
jgi:hypothetical protein